MIVTAVAARHERLPCARQPDDRNLSVGLLQIARELGRLGDDPVPRSSPFVSVQELGLDLVPMAADLDRDLVGVAGQIVDPRRMLRRATLRSDDEPLPFPAMPLGILLRSSLPLGFCAASCRLA